MKLPEMELTMMKTVAWMTYGELVQVGKVTADCYFRVATQLKKQVTPIPTNDI